MSELTPAAPFHADVSHATSADGHWKATYAEALQDLEMAKRRVEAIEAALGITKETH